MNWSAMFAVAAGCGGVVAIFGSPVIAAGIFVASGLFAVAHELHQIGLK